MNIDQIDKRYQIQTPQNKNIKNHFGLNADILPLNQMNQTHLNFP
jgi:hypothetical protein